MDTKEAFNPSLQVLNGNLRIGELSRDRLSELLDLPFGYAPAVFDLCT